MRFDDDDDDEEEDAILCVVEEDESHVELPLRLAKEGCTDKEAATKQPPAVKNARRVAAALESTRNAEEERADKRKARLERPRDTIVLAVKNVVGNTKPPKTKNEATWIPEIIFVNFES